MEITRKIDCKINLFDLDLSLKQEKVGITVNPDA